MTLPDLKPARRCPALCAAVVTALLCACALDTSDESSAEEHATSGEVDGGTKELGSVVQGLGTGTPKFGSVWAEELSDFTLAQIKSALPLIQGKDIALNLHWKSSLLDDANRWAIVADAKAKGIQVNPWLLLPAEVTTADKTPGSATYAKTGYFPGATNYVEFISKAKSLMSLWTDTKGYAPTTFVVDMEMRRSRMEQYVVLANALGPVTVVSDTADIIQFLRAGMNTTQYTAATKAYKDFVDYAHSKGWKVEVTTTDKTIDDYSDGDGSLRQAFGTPIDGINWDTVSFQAYRTLATDMWSNNPLLICTAFFVQDYAKMAKRIFGAKTGIDLGLTDAGISTNATLYADGTMLSEDIEAALEGGISAAKLSVFSLNGMVKRTPSSQWLAGPTNHGFGWPSLASDACAPASHAVAVAIDTTLGFSPNQ